MSRVVGRFGLLVALGAAVAISPLGALGLASAHGGSARRACSWRTVASAPFSFSSAPQLTGVAGISRSEAWIVGVRSKSGPNDTSFSEHWNGHRWKVLPVAPVGDSDQLRAVARIPGTRRVLAVGWWERDKPPEIHPLVEEWTGSRWVALPAPDSPDPTGFYSQLNGLTVRSGRDAWAVGSYVSQTHGGQQPLIEHWEGRRWSVVASPVVPVYAALNDVVAFSGTDAWAVGYQGGAEPGAGSPLIEHWNGVAWSLVQAPAPSDLASLHAVSGTSGNDIWAVGSYDTTADIWGKSLIEHWDGQSWRVVDSPDPFGNLHNLEGVIALSRRDAVAVGLEGQVSSGGGTRYHTFIERWTGGRWVAERAPGEDPLYAVDSVPGSSMLWAAGSNDEAGAATDPNAVLRYC